MAQLLHIADQPADPETAAIARVARYLDGQIQTRWIGAYIGQDQATLAHDFGLLGPGVSIRVNELATPPGVTGRRQDRVRLSLDFLVGSPSIDGALAVRSAADLAWRVRAALYNQLVAIPFLAGPWQFDSTVPWLESENVHIKSLIMVADCHLLDWEKTLVP